MGEVKVQSHNMSLTSYWLTSNPFGSMSIDPPIPERLRFQNLTLKIQSQSHSSRSYSRYNTLSTHIPFVPCWSALPYLGYSYFKIWHWKFKVKVMGEVKAGSHNMSPTFNMVPWDPFQGAHHQGEIREIMENKKKISLIWKNHGIPFPGKNHGKVMEIRIPEKKICFDSHFNACITI